MAAWALRSAISQGKRWNNQPGARRRSSARRPTRTTLTLGALDQQGLDQAGGRYLGQLALSKAAMACTAGTDTAKGRPKSSSSMTRWRKTALTSPRATNFLPRSSTSTA